MNNEEKLNQEKILSTEENVLELTTKEKVGYRSKLKTLTKRQKTIGIIGVILICSLIIFLIARNSYGFTLSEKSKNEKILNVLANKNYNKARTLNERFFGNDTKGNKDFYNYNNTVINAYENLGIGTAKEFKEIEEYVNTISIEKVAIKKGYMRKIQVLVKNNSNKDVNYVKINLYYKDSLGNIIYSDWTNDSSCIKPNSTQIIETYVNEDINFSKIQAEVANFNY